MATTAVSRRRRLTPIQFNAIGLLLSGMTQRKVATKIGVSEDVVWRWMNQNFEFQAELARRQGMILSTDVRRICHYRSVALRKLRLLVDSPDESISLAACKELLKVGGYSSGDVTVNLNNEPQMSAEDLRAELARLKAELAAMPIQAVDVEAKLIEAPKTTDESDGTGESDNPTK